eukprot:GFUD01003509.1.p1 GENE.GFUD01003509.1~~GFUD01003509.1.p1  ORF type:complete len:1004 (-),score=191.87 GFUD01003509.1:42-3053(-)
MNIIPLLVIIVHVSENDGLRCGPKGRCGTCHCSSHYNSIYDLKLECPSMMPWRRKLVLETAKMKGGHLLEITCEEAASKSDMASSIRDIDIGNVINLKINNCPLAESFGDIIEKVNGDSTEVKSLTIQFMKYEDEKLEGKHFFGLSKVVNLSLDFNQIDNIDEDFFAFLSDLEILNLNGNQGIRFHPKSLQNLHSLKVLQMSTCNISSLHSQLFKNLLNLQNLNLHNNKIQQLPSTVFKNLTGLIRLNLSNNKIKALPNAIFDDLENIEEIIIDNNPILNLPELLFARNKKLKKLSFVFDKRYLSSKSKIEETSLKLPSMVFQNLKIEKIHLENIQIDDLAEHIFKGCSELDTLIVKGGLLKGLPKNIFESSEKLHKLDFSHNNIEVLPLSVFKGLVNLEYLNLNDNMLTQLDPNLFRESINLKYINLSKNQFYNISDLYLCEHVQEIDLSYNNLMSDTPIFSKDQVFEKLKILNLSHNKLSSLETCVNKEWTGVGILDLSHNSFTGTIPFISFLKYNVSEIDLSNNQIEKVVFSTSVLKEKNKENHLKLILSNNPLKCDCFATELKQLLERKTKVQSYIFLSKSIIIEFKNFPCKDISLDELNCLYLNEECTNKCSCSLNRYRNEVSVNCSHRNLQKFPEKIPAFFKETRSIRLILSHNKITSMDISNKKREFLDKVTHLDLSFNEIKYVDETHLPRSIKELYLNNNKITKFNQSCMNYFNSLTNKTSLRFSNNPFECSCDSLELFDLVKSRYSIISDFSNISFSCFAGPVYPESAEQDQICSNITQLLRLFLPVFTFFGVILVLLILMVQFKESLKIWCFAQSWTRIVFSEELMDKDKKYDAFISYSHHDSDYVENILWKELETPSNPKDPAYKCKVHTRDFIPGEMIPDQILASVHESRRTIIVLSKEYVKADWTRMEFKEAHKNSIKDNRQRLILVVHGDLSSSENLDNDLRAYIKLNAFIHTGDKDFWKKIRSALPRINQQSRKEMKDPSDSELKDLL